MVKFAPQPQKRVAKRAYLYAYALIAPAILIILLLTIYPVARAFLMSLFQFPRLAVGFEGGKFVGLGNYIQLFRDPLLKRIFFNTLYWTVGSVIGQFTLGFGLAILLNRSLPFRQLIRGIIVAPMVVPGIVTALIFSLLFAPDAGLLNTILLRLNIISQSIPFLSNYNTVMPALILTNIWQGTPFQYVMLLSGLQAIPQELYEVAEMDGASPLAKFIHVTIPSMRSTIVISLLICIIWAFRWIELVYVMTFGGPADRTNILAFQAWVETFINRNSGGGAALGTSVTLILLSFSVIYLWLVKSEAKPEG